MNSPDASSCAGRLSAAGSPSSGGLVLFEDAHLLVVNKPAGLNTHAPSPFAGEGLYEWLRDREPRWSNLAIIHRLDKETSGVLVFGKTTLANQSLTSQFAQHRVRKQYVLWTDRPVPQASFTAVSAIVRAGEKYRSRPLHAGGDRAETRFRKGPADRQGYSRIEAEATTGRTHQIRVHAAAHGFPILGDRLYGGTAWPRLCLHAASLTLHHPSGNQSCTFQAEADFCADPRRALREALMEPTETNAFRLVHGASDGWPGWYVDRLGDWLLSQSESALTRGQWDLVERMEDVRGIYHLSLPRQSGRTGQAKLAPQLVRGQTAPDQIIVRENGTQFELRLHEGCSVGLFLDQRDNRRRFLVNHVAAGFPLFDGAAAGREVLNTFAYTCGFSVCAARAGARTTNVDLSRKYLEWGNRNFALNDLDPAEHDFLCGDVFDWLRRLNKRQRRFDGIVLDPPTFSRSKEQGLFRAEKDYARLLLAALPLLKPRGVALASMNAAAVRPESFLKTIEAAVTSARRRLLELHYVPQPPDFPITREEPAYLKTAWLRIG